MPFTQKDLDDLPIYFERPGQATVLVGPCSGSPWLGATIPLDGRHYKCAGKIILKNGRELFANLRIRTHDFDFLERDSVYCLLGDKWYRLNEPELFGALGLTRDQALPYTWLPDRPLDYHEKGPYPMDPYDREVMAGVRHYLRKRGGFSVAEWEQAIESTPNTRVIRQSESGPGAEVRFAYDPNVWVRSGDTHFLVWCFFYQDGYVSFLRPMSDAPDDPIRVAALRFAELLGARIVNEAGVEQAS